MIDATGSEEHDLIVQAQQGNRWAFGQLVSLHQKGVVNVVYRMCGDAKVAEDAAQEAFIRAWQSMPKYKPRAPFRNWLYRIALNLAVDMLRRERAVVDIDTLPLPNVTDNPERRVVHMERAAYIRNAVLKLPDASRAVLVLREFESLSYREIAEVLDIPMGTVMSRLNYARKKLRKALEPYLEVL